MYNSNNSRNRHSLKDVIKKTFLEKKTLDRENVEILKKINEDIKCENYDNFHAYNKIKEYGLFDEEYYISQCEFVPEIDPLIHYIYYGHLLNMNPCKLFDTNYYRKFNKNVNENENPLVYFVNKGIKEGIIKVNEKLWQPLSINKFELDERLKNFNSYGLNCEIREIPIIISLTSYPKRIHEVTYTIYSLLNQTIKPDMLILWLSAEEFPNRENDLPSNLLNFLKCGLTIKWCENITSFKKLIPVYDMYPDSLIVTADDDLFYESTWLEKLYNHHLIYPKDIVAHRVRKISFKGSKVDNYLNWPVSKKEDDALYLNFFTTGGGVLFPPHSLSNKMNQKNLFNSLCPSNDDMWFWAMAVLNDTKIRVVKDNISNITYVSPERDILFEKDTLWSYNEFHNDEQFGNLLTKFPEIYEKIFQEHIKYSSAK